jgi:nucleoside-diphosphate-sugar epimerase
MASYLVTGANGFIGKRLTKTLLDSGNKVFAVVTDKKAMDDLACSNLIVLDGFFADYDRLFHSVPAGEIDTVFHFAWQGLCGKDVKDYRAQLDDAKYACDAFVYSQEIKAKRFILISSINTAETITYLTGENHSIPRYTNVYGIAKLSAEMIGKTIAANVSGTMFNCAQLSMVYGEGNYSKMVPNVVISSLVRGVSPSLIKGERLYDLVYVGDVVSGLLAISAKGKNLETYPIGHVQLKTFKELFTEVGLIINPDIPLKFGVYPGDVEIDFSTIDFQKTYNDTGFSARADLKATILSTANWIRSAGLSF